MLRTVTITIEIDPSEYSDSEDSDEGAVDLIEACFQHETDFPETASVTCGAITKEINVD
jgi:hypothetical protein